MATHFSPALRRAARVRSIIVWSFIGQKSLYPSKEKLGLSRRTFVHPLSDFLGAAQHCGFTLKALQEWWYEQDAGKPPRLVSLLLERAG